MLRTLTAAQSRAVEAAAIAETGVTLYELMQSAGTAVSDEVTRRFPNGRVVVLAGPGNNGGDGWVAARLLAAAGRDVFVYALRGPEGLPSEAAASARAAFESGVESRVGTQSPSVDDLAHAGVIIDALLGTGSRPPLSDELATWCEAATASARPIVSVDLPTGVDGDSGRADARALSATATVTFTAPKSGMLLRPAAAFCGEVVVAEIGIPPASLDAVGSVEVWDETDYGSLVPVPALDAHKNSRGRLLIIAGSECYPGAAVLAAKGAQRSGAGYVTLAVPEPVVATAQAHLLAAPVVGLPAAAGGFSEAAVGATLALAGEYDAVVIGPGVGRTPEVASFVRTVCERVVAPLLIDADALAALAGRAAVLDARSAPTVLTPHPGELAHLLGIDAGEVQADRVSSSARLAGSRTVVVLKGAGTVVSGEGRQVLVTAGSPALATAGSGDVLSGVIGALIAQGLGALEAAALGAHVHARAGEAAAVDLTEVCVNAEDLPGYLPGAFAALLKA